MLTGQAGQRFHQAQMGLAGLGLNEIAKGFIDKGKEMGIDKAILARVAEVRVSNSHGTRSSMLET